AAGIYSFAVAAGIPVTGVAGISAILYRLFGVPMGLSNVLINIPIILCTYKLLGRAFFLRSVYCMILF
ncbi:YitT family protein, partial [Atlantibacter subterraneus]|uniref:YitT family protein n=2 Tax=Bacteria TaxID=2 RepID=UPI0022EA1534